MSDNNARIERLERMRNAPRDYYQTLSNTIARSERSRTQSPVASATASRSSSLSRSKRADLHPTSDSRHIVTMRRAPSKRTSRNGSLAPSPLVPGSLSSSPLIPGGFFPSPSVLPESLAPSPSIPVEGNAIVDDQLGAALSRWAETMSSTNDDNDIVMDELLPQEESSQLDESGPAADTIMSSPTRSAHDHAVQDPMAEQHAQQQEDTEVQDIHPSHPDFDRWVKSGASKVARERCYLEAAHYGTWKNICHDSFRVMRRLPARQCIATADILPQFPSGGSLSDTMISGAAYLRARSVRIPDWSQITVLHKSTDSIDEEDEDSPQTSLLQKVPEEDEMDKEKEAYEEGEYEDDEDSPEKPLPHRVTLLVEIKPVLYGKNGAPSSSTIAHHIKKGLVQLREQSYHLLGEEPSVAIIGGILAFGSHFTYKEVARNNAAVKRAFERKGNQEYLDTDDEEDRDENESKAVAEIEKEFSTHIGRELFATFGDGERFINAESSAGKAILEKIRIRAMELAPDFYSDSWAEDSE